MVNLKTAARKLQSDSVNSEENKDLCRWLKIQRILKGHTMVSLSKILGTSHSFIGKIENLERRLDVIEYVRYCQALEVDPFEGLKLVVSSIEKRR